VRADQKFTKIANIFLVKEGLSRMAKRINASALEAFIRHILPEKLRKDLHTFHIIREADLACCVYFHLRRFLHSDRSWKVFAERHSYVTGHFIDVLIFREGLENSKKCQRPRIAIELKWNWNRISKKDRASLDKCIDLLGLDKAYFITVFTKKKEYHRIVKTNQEKFRLFEVHVPLGLHGQALKDWKDGRKLFIKMSLGKRGKA
jgi:hypothetical protein